MRNISRRKLLAGIAGGAVLAALLSFGSGCKGTSSEKISGCGEGDKQITVLAIAKAREGMEEEVRQELVGLLAPTRAENGCISFNLHYDPDDKSRFMFYENWACRQVWDVHLRAPHIEAFAGKADSLLAEPIEVTVWEISD